jgi:N-acetylmuramoyl-L-alanine amidase
MPQHKVKQGDCITNIAHRYGFYWETIWNHANNAQLKSLRKDPDVLFPGDVVFIPEKEEKQESGATEARHRFRVKGNLAYFRMIVEHDGKPIKNADYTLQIGSDTHTGTTNNMGLIETYISPTARSGKLTVADLEIDLELGSIDPVDEDVGIQERLQNLGFYEGEINGEINDEMERALTMFQQATGLEVTGQLDDETRQKLIEWQDEEHEKMTSEDSERSDNGSEDGLDEETGEPDDEDQQEES